MYHKINIYCIAEALAGGLVSAGGSLVGSTLGLIGQSMANKTNKEIAEANNKAMLQAMREQTKSEQDYNSASAQMQRAMIAGLNPMTLAGQSPTSASSSGVPSLDSPVIQNPFGEFDLGSRELGSAMIQAEQLKLQKDNIDVQDFNSKITLLKTIGDLSKDVNLTSDDVRNLVSSVFGQDNPYSSQIGNIFKDDFVRKRITNGIQESDLDIKQKNYLFGWLDEFTNAQYLLTLSEIEGNQTQANVNRSISSLNDAKKREVEQAIRNMQEQWKSLNFQGELDGKKLLRVAQMSEAIVDDLVNSASISRQEAQNWVWRTLMENQQSTGVKVGPFSVNRTEVHPSGIVPLTGEVINSFKR